MPQRLPKSEYYKRAKARGFEWVNEPPRRTKDKGLIRCSNGHEWPTSLDKITCGYGCPYCSQKARKTPEDFMLAAQEAGVEWIGPEAPNATTDTQWRCPNGHIWSAPYNRIAIAKSGCGVCFGTRKKTDKDYNEVANKFSLEWLGPNPGRTRDKTWWRCQDNHEFSSRYADVKNGHGCPTCKNASVGENIIAAELNIRGIQFEREKTFDKCVNQRQLPFDFYVMFDNAHVLIEFDGKQHFKPTWDKESFEATKHRDAIKDQFARDSNIPLIRISYRKKSKIPAIIEELANRYA